MDANWLRKFENGVVTTLNAGTGSANGPLTKAQFNRWMSQGAALSFGASDGAGGAILAWERQNPAGGVLVEHAFLREDAGRK